MRAGVAQLVEQLIRNQQVTGSSPVTSSKLREDGNLLFFYCPVTWITKSMYNYVVRFVI